MTAPARIGYLTDIHFGAGASQMVPDLVRGLGAHRPLVVTDGPLVEAGFVQHLGLDAPVVFDAVPPNPTESAARAALAIYRAESCDGLVGLGGGSPMDLAKAVALLVHHAGPLAPYALIHGGVERITARMPPLVAVPTTAGTGAEVGRAALITLDSGDKLALISAHLIPRAAVCDPGLTRSLPPVLTAATGMDAVAHCIETFCSPQFNPVAEAIALDGLSRAWHAIRRALAAPQDLAARADMMMAALQGGLTFQKGLGAVHALSHPLGGLSERHLHHGTLNAIFLPHVLRFNADACPDRLARLAACLDLAGPDAVAGAVADMVASLGLPGRLRDLGLAAPDLQPMVPRALRDHCSRTNPRPMDLESCRRLYADAL